MTFKKIFIIILIAIAAFYIFKVKGFNPFDSKIKSDIVLTSLDGKAMPLSECVGENGTFIFYMSTWCPYCSDEIDRIKPLNDFFKLHKINILVGMYGPSNDEIHNWVSKHDFPWNWKTFYWEERFDSEFKLKKIATPYLTSINQKGIVTFSKSGALYADEVSKAAAEMLKSNKL